MSTTNGDKKLVNTQLYNVSTSTKSYPYVALNNMGGISWQCWNLYDRNTKHITNEKSKI